MTVNDKLTKMMEDRKLGVIASRAGIHYCTLRSYLKYGKQPSSRNAFSLARALGVSVEWLLDDAQEWPPKLAEVRAQAA